MFLDIIINVKLTSLKDWSALVEVSVFFSLSDIAFYEKISAVMVSLNIHKNRGTEIPS